jgi:hypothetical protein
VRLCCVCVVLRVGRGLTTGGGGGGEVEEGEIACYYYNCELKESSCKRISACDMGVYGKP